MESLDITNKVLQHAWSEFVNHFDAEANAHYLYSEELIDDTTMDVILKAKSKKSASQSFLLYLRSNATIESLDKLCTLLRRTARDHPRHCCLAKTLEEDLKQQQKDLSYQVSTLVDYSHPKSKGTQTESSPAVVTQPRAHVSPHTPGVSDQSANLQGGLHETPSHQEPRSSESQGDFKFKLDLAAVLDKTYETSIVKVTDLELDESDVDTIDDVFSNEDEEGGDIVDIDIAQLNEKGFVLITFMEPDVAKQVCQKKQWRVMGQTAMVSLYRKDTTPIKKLLTVARNHPQHAIIILDLPNSERHSDADVTLRLEKITKLELEDSTTAIYEHVATKALMVLSDGDPNFKDSIVSKINDYSKSPKARKDFAQISALNFPQVKKVIISGVKDEMCHEHKLQPYFANRKLSRGGPGCSVEVVDRGRAVVSFKESAHANSTLEIDHEKTLGKGVTVLPYHHLFEGWLSVSAAAKDTHEQQGFDCEVQSELKCAYLTKNSHHLTEFNGRLRENCATVKLDAAQRVFHVKPRQGSQFIQEWKANCKKLIEEFLESYREDLVSIPEGTSGAAFELLFTVAKDYPLVEVNSQAGHESVSVVGPAADVTTVVERLQRVVNESMDFNEVIKFAPAVLHYVHNHARKKLKEKHPRVDFKTSLQEGCIEVIGKTAKCEEFIEALKKIKPSSAKVNISPDAVHLLTSPVGREYILDKMPTQVEISHFFTDENDALEDAQVAIYVNLYIVADSSLSAQVHQVAKDIESSLCTKKIDVPNEFQYTIRNQAWNDFKQGVEQRCVAQLLPHAADPLVVICDHQLTEKLAQEIQSFVQENCYTEETVTFSSGQWRFIFDYSREWIIIEDLIKKTCNYNSVEEGRSTAIHLQGETTPSKTLAKKVRNLRDSICTDTIEVSRPSLVDHFSSEEGRRHIKGIAAAHKAVVEVSTAEEKEHVNEMIEQEKKHPVLISGTLADGVIVEVRKGDLTELEVDVIVNAANEQLSHGGGVAGQIRSKGGSIIQDESDQYVRRNGSVDIGKAVILKSTGDLPCKSIVHAVGPRWRGGNHNEPHLLSKAISASLTETVKKGFTSIAFPAIGAEIFGVPIEVCTKAMFEGLCSFFSMSKHQMKVFIMVYQQEHVEPFISAARKSLNDVVEPKMHVMTEHPSGTAPMPRRTSSHTMASAITTDLEISHGSLLDYHADVYINSTLAGLDLNSGAVSKSLLKAGGSALQDECKRHVRQKGSVQEWGFFTSGPGNLKCRKVIHTVGGNYNGGSGRRGMETMITNVMKECDRLKASTVAFPSIGTGALGFPHNIAADIMITTVSTYLSQHRTTAIKKVLFVIFDQPVLKAFKAKEATLPAVQPQLSSASSSTRRRPSARSRGSNTPTVKLSNLSFQLQPTRPVIGTQIQQGSLTDVVTDVYVDTTSADLDLKSRPVSKALLQAGGQALQDECTKHVQQNGKVPAWSFATTGPGTLKCKHVLHTVAADYDGPGGSAEKGMEGMLHRVLEECDRLKATSVAIPSSGAGNFRFPPSVLANLMLRTVSSYLDKSRDSRITKVLFVIFDGNLLKEFQEAQSANFEQLSDQFFSMSHQPYRKLSYLVLSVYAQTKEIVSTVIKELHAVIDKEFVTEPVQEDLIQELSNDDVAVLYQRAVDLQVELDLDREVGSVTVRGAKTNVGQAKLFLKDTLHQIEIIRMEEQFEVERAIKEEQEMVKQSYLVASIFRWQRIISGQFEDFPHDVSFFIEQARLDNQPACRIPGEAGEEYEVDFASMTIRDCSGNSGEVRRFDFEEDRKQAQKQLAEGRGHIVHPTHWEPMPVDSKGREAVFHPVVLSTNDQEYKEVLQDFEKTMTTQFNRTAGMSHYTSILAIKRIQNPTLYSTYVTRRTVMEKANPKGTQNERRLFHGCAFDAAANICQTGFNRSFCGKNAVAFGKGSYFAVNASFSASDTYSPRNNNDNGRKHVFFARVLTGEFTQGHASFQDPPSKDAQSKFDSVVNNLANPGMYVVFYDTQAYPDYLIEFN